MSNVIPFALLYGVLLGARHAFEPDHLAAVSTLAAHGASRGEVLRVAAAWGGGHATTVIVAGALLGTAHLPAWLVGRAELAAGITLIVLGVWTIYRVRRYGVHAHVHIHDGLPEHTHFHIHGVRDEHEPHPIRSSWIRQPVAAYAFGTLHGLAGSGAAAALAALAAPTTVAALAYLLCFGIGSLLGMVAVGIIALWPMLRISSNLPRVGAWIDSAAGVGSVAVGLLLVARVGGLFQ